MRSLLAWLANRSIDLVGAVIGAAARARVTRNAAAFPALSQALSQVPFSLGWKLRQAVYARLLRGDTVKALATKT